MQPTGERTGVFSDRRLSQTVDGVLVPETHEAAAFLAYPIGGEVQPHHLKQYKAILNGDAPVVVKDGGSSIPDDDLEGEPAAVRRRAPAKKATPRKRAAR